MIYEATVINIRPVPQTSVTTKGKRACKPIKISDSASSKAWKMAVALQSVQSMPKGYKGAVIAHLEFRFPRPMDHFDNRGVLKEEFRDTRCVSDVGNVDTLANSTLDALEGKGCIVNDCRVWQLMSTKVWIVNPDLAGVYIKIWTDEDGAPAPDLQRMK